MAAANPLNLFSSTPTSSKPSSSRNSAGQNDQQSFGASLADAKEIGRQQHAAESNAQSQGDGDGKSAGSGDKTTAADKGSSVNDASKDAGSATETAQTVAPWLALLQAQLAQQAQQVPTSTTSTTAASTDSTNPQLADAISTSGAASTQTQAALKTTLNNLVASQKTDTSKKADPEDSKATDLLSALKAAPGKGAATAADLAADDKDLPQLLAQNKDDGLLKQDDKSDASALAALGSGVQANSTVATEAAKAATVTRQVQEPVGSDKWGAAVAQQVSIMVGKQEQHMEMQLNPPNLGPMEVKLSIAQDQASVIFTSQHANVREALAAATPKLTALLADQGITLTNVQVASDSLNQQAQQQAQQQQQSGNHRRSAFASGDDGNTPQLTRISGEVRLPVAKSGLNLYV